MGKIIIISQWKSPILITKMLELTVAQILEVGSDLCDHLVQPECQDIVKMITGFQTSWKED